MPSSSSQPLLQSYIHNIPNPLLYTTTTLHLKILYRTLHHKAQTFLSSRLQHYIVLTLVSLDLLGIFADIIIDLYQCDEADTDPQWNDVKAGLGVAGLVFSCMFMAELGLSVWAFGWRYFKSWFHILDATVIIVGLALDIALHGILEEVASLVVVLRLWRFFKIIEEFGVGAQEQMDGLNMRINQLEVENDELKREVRRWKGSDV